MAGAGVWAAGRAGIAELKGWLVPVDPAPRATPASPHGPAKAKRLSSRDRRRLRKMLEGGAAQETAAPFQR